MKKTIYASLLVTLVVITGSGFLLKKVSSVPMTVPLNVKDLAEHGLNIIGPADPAFNVTVSALQKNKPSPALESVRPFSVLIKNTGRRAAIAFVLKWELMEADGKVHIETNQYVTNWSLMGRGTTDPGGNIIRPNAAWFLSPGFGMEVGSPGFVDDPKLTGYLNRMGGRLAQYTNITVSLDGVFFDDGEFIGPNTTEFFEKVGAIRDATWDLRREIKDRIKGGKSSEEALSYVADIAQGPRVRLGRSSTAADYYNYYKQMEAESLLRVRSKSGNDKAVEHAVEPLRRTWLELRKHPRG